MTQKITPKDYERFSQAWLAGISNDVLAKQYDVSSKHVSRVVRKLCDLEMITEQEFKDCKARRAAGVVHERNVKVDDESLIYFANDLLLNMSTSDLASKYSVAKKSVKRIIKRIAAKQILEQSQVQKIRELRAGNIARRLSKNRRLQYESKITSLLNALLIEGKSFEQVIEEYGTDRKFYKRAFKYAIANKVAVQGKVADSTLFEMFKEYKERVWDNHVERMRNSGVYERATSNVTKYGAQDPLYYGDVKFRSKGEGFLGLMLMNLGLVDDLKKGENFQVPYDGLRLDFLVNGYDVEYHIWPVNHNGLEGQTLGSWLRKRKQTFQESFVPGVDCNGKILLVTASINDNKLLRNQTYLIAKHLNPQLDRDEFNTVYDYVKDNMSTLLKSEPRTQPVKEEDPF